MSPALLLLVGAIYCWVAWNYYQQGQHGMCMAFVSYALANVGFAMDAH